MGRYSGDCGPAKRRVSLLPISYTRGHLWPSDFLPYAHAAEAAMTLKGERRAGVEVKVHSSRFRRQHEIGSGVRQFIIHMNMASVFSACVSKSSVYTEPNIDYRGCMTLDTPGIATEESNTLIGHIDCCAR